MQFFVNHFVLEKLGTSVSLPYSTVLAVTLSPAIFGSPQLLLVTLRMAKWVWASGGCFTVVHKHTL